MQPPILGIVVPCYNETEVFPCALHELQVLRSTLVSELRISEKSFLFFVDDGSEDATWPMIEAACAAQPMLVRGLKLARNYGHQNALLAGLMAQIGKADAVVSLDADLQATSQPSALWSNCLSKKTPISYLRCADRARMTPDSSG